jgi:hypothetical protein
MHRQSFQGDVHIFFLAENEQQRALHSKVWPYQDKVCWGAFGDAQALERVERKSFACLY